MDKEEHSVYEGKASITRNELLDIKEIFKSAIGMGASDVHITVGSPVIARIDNKLTPVSSYKLKPQDTVAIVKSTLSDYQYMKFLEEGEQDFSLPLQGLGRFRVNCYKQRGSFSLAFRAIPNEIPTLESLHLPNVLEELTEKKRGLVLVTGPTGSGKSTTLASMIDIINKREKNHIITIEDPIEYLHSHKNSLVNQREIGHDSKSFSNALRASLRQDPDVIMVGEMRDLETISTALTAAETGHLVFSTLHTLGSAKTIDRVIDVFPPHQQQQIKVQLSSVLMGIVSQQLVEKKDGTGRIVAVEVLTMTSAVRNLIREGKTHQIQTAIQTGKSFGMISMDAHLINLYRSGEITKESCIKYAIDKDYVTKQVDFMNVNSF